MATMRHKRHTYAITLSTFQRHRHFQRTAHAELFIATLFRYRDQGRFLVHGFVVMPDHVHVLITPALDQPTARSIQLIKGGYSHVAGDSSSQEIWQSGHHEHRIRDAADYNSQFQYIANNPARKRLELYPYVHTAFVPQLDLWPAAP
jgi:putative transposase